MKCGGIVVCGGKSQRMGRPKAWLPFGNEVLLQRIVRILSVAVDPIVVVAAPEQELPPLAKGVIVARDAAKGRGPLQGLGAGLASLEGKAEAAFVSSCDVPFLKPELVTQMISLLGDARIAIPHVGEHYHPLAAVYRVDVLPEVLGLLEEDRLRPFFLIERVKTRVVEAGELIGIDPSLESLRNLNTPEEYAEALKHASLEEH